MVKFANSNRQMVMFGEDWGAHPSSTQHLCKGLLSDWNIIWVNSIGMRTPQFSIRDISRIAHKAYSFFVTSEIRDNLCPQAIVKPLLLPYHNSKLINHFNNKLFGNLLNKTCRTMAFDKPILWTSVPTAINYIDTIPARSLIYYCCDDFSSLPGVDHALANKCEAKLIDHADLIIVMNDQLAKKFPQEKTKIVPHGVDYELFTENKKRPDDLPIADLVIGFYGSFESWVDIDLIKHIAQQLPQAAIVLIGKNKLNLQSLFALPNIYYLGEKPYEQLAAYSQHWDASIIPFKKTSEIHYSTPLKLLEYLAVGKPIFTTRFPATEQYVDNVFYFEDNDTINKIPDLIASWTEKNIQKSRNRMIEHSWKNRASELSVLLSSL